MQQGFGSTPKERCRQEINVIANGLDADLKLIRRQIITNYHSVDPKPVLHLTAQIEGAIAVAAEKLEGTEHYWRERT